MGLRMKGSEIFIAYPAGTGSWAAVGCYWLLDAAEKRVASRSNQM